MNTATETKKETLKHTFSLTVEIDEGWIDYLVQSNDIFNGNRAGYWLRGVEFEPELGWLCWEDDEKHRWRNEPNRQGALKAWREGKPLPEHWFRLDRAAALRAWEEGVKRWGVDWYEQVDASVEDTVVQLALLGETRYG
jgi:hypothetical protein